MPDRGHPTSQRVEIPDAPVAPGRCPAIADVGAVQPQMDRGNVGTQTSLRTRLPRSHDEVGGEVGVRLGIDNGHDLERVAGATLDQMAGPPVRDGGDERPEVVAAFVEETEVVERHGRTTVADQGHVYRYAWGNNPRRAELKGRLCRVDARGRMNTVLVRFLDTGERVTTSRRALRASSSS